MGSALTVVLGGLALGAIGGATGAWWLHRRTSLSAVNVYLCAPVGVAPFVGALLVRTYAPGRTMRRQH
jgi:hypothetical protein